MVRLHWWIKFMDLTQHFVDWWTKIIINAQKRKWSTKIHNWEYLFFMSYNKCHLNIILCWSNIKCMSRCFEVNICGKVWTHFLLLKYLLQLPHFGKTDFNLDWTDELMASLRVKTKVDYWHLKTTWTTKMSQWFRQVMVYECLHRYNF